MCGRNPAVQASVQLSVLAANPRVANQQAYEPMQASNVHPRPTPRGRGWMPRGRGELQGIGRGRAIGRGTQLRPLAPVMMGPPAHPYQPIQYAPVQFAPPLPRNVWTGPPDPSSAVPSDYIPPIVAPPSTNPPSTVSSLPATVLPPRPQTPRDEEIQTDLAIQNAVNLLMDPPAINDNLGGRLIYITWAVGVIGAHNFELNHRFERERLQLRHESKFYQRALQFGLHQGIFSWLCGDHPLPDGLPEFYFLANHLVRPSGYGSVGHRGGMVGRGRNGRGRGVPQGGYGGPQGGRGGPHGGRGH